MASHLVEIFCTEKDKVNCPFYWKIGACRHGDKCIRLHNRPVISQTLLVPHMYMKPITPEGLPMPEVPENKEYLQQHFEEFYEDVFEELSKFGEIEDMNVCDNTADHLIGNVYVKFRKEDGAQNAYSNLNGRFFAGRPLAPEYSPVTDFRDACCRQDERSECRYGGLCNFLHLKKVSRSLLRRLYKDQRKKWHDDRRGRDRDERRSSRERSRYRDERDDKDREKDRGDRPDRADRGERPRDKDFDVGRERDRSERGDRSDRKDKRDRDSDREKSKDKDRARDRDSDSSRMKSRSKDESDDRKRKHDSQRGSVKRPKDSRDNSEELLLGIESE